MPQSITSSLHLLIELLDPLLALGNHHLLVHLLGPASLLLVVHLLLQAFNFLNQISGLSGLTCYLGVQMVNFLRLSGALRALAFQSLRA